MKLSGREFRFGEWLVQPQLMRFAKDGATVHVTPRAMAVLVCLAEAEGGVVARNAILDAVWPRMAVSPDALTQCIVELRKALGDRSRKPVYIETIPKVGVRLLAPVIVSDSAAALTHAAQRPLASNPWIQRRPAAAIALIAVVGVVTLAGMQLVYRPRSEAPDMPTESATAWDAYLTGNEYRMTGKNPLDALPIAVRYYRIATEEDPQFAEAWARLGMAHAGMYWYGIDRAPTRLRDAEHAIRRAFEIRPELPEAHLALGDLHYRQGQYRAALTEFEVAEASMPRDAHLLFLRASVLRRLNAWERSVSDFERAVALAPRNVAFLRQLHITLLFRRDYERAEQILDRINTIEPDNVTAFIDRIVLDLCRDGSSDRAQQYAQSPPTAAYGSGLGYTYVNWLAAVFTREYDKALDILDRDRSDQDLIFDGDLRTSRTPKRLLYARTYELAGYAVRARSLFDSAILDIEKQIESSAVEDVTARAAFYLSLAEAHAALGNVGIASQWLERARGLVPKADDPLFGSALQLAAAIRVSMRLVDYDRVVQELEDYLLAPGHWSLEGLLLDPRLEPIRTRLEQLRPRVARAAPDASGN